MGSIESATTPMPVVFVGHGNPMHAISTDRYTEAWRAIGASMPRPTAIVSISAHWYIDCTRVTAMERPQTIHDFGGFPEELFAVEYPAPGSPALAERLAEILAPVEVGLSTSWGLDHGTWSVLVHMFPDADIPVVQLGIDRTQPPEFHYELGQKLQALRDEGVLIFASGNVVHNLHAYAWGQETAEPFPWAVDFEQTVRASLDSHDHAPIIAYETLGESAMMSVPTPDHYLPLLYVISLCRGGERVSYPVAGFDGGSISMLAIQVG